MTTSTAGMRDRVTRALDVLLLLVGLMIASCHGSATHGSSGGTTGTAAPDRDTFCQQTEDARCALMKACGKIDPASHCHAMAFDPTCADPLLNYDSTAATSCLDALNAAVQANSCSALGGVSACGAVLSPSVAAGGTCTRDVECQVSLDGGFAFCARNSTCQGVCLQSTGRLGDACRYETSDCKEGACNGLTATCEPLLPEGAECGTFPVGCDPAHDTCSSTPPESCVPLAATGEACSETSDCVAEDLCPRVDGGTCVAAVPSGAACGVDAGTCQRGLVCLDGTCTPSDGTAYPCTAVSSCDVDRQTCVNGACVTSSRVGGACPCVWGALCSNGTCVSPPPIGAACNWLELGACAPGGACQDGGCVPLVGFGEACGANGVCQGGYCDASGVCQRYLPTGSPCQPGMCGPPDCAYGPDNCIDVYCRESFSGGTCAGYCPP